MKIAGMVLGLVGAVIGLVLSIIILAAGASMGGLGLFGLGNAFIILGIIDIVVCLVAIAGAAISTRAPIAGGVMMIVVGAAGFVLFAPLYWIASFVLLVAGGALAIAGRGARPAPYQIAGGGQVAMAAPKAQARAAASQNQPYQKPVVGGWGGAAGAPAGAPAGVAATSAGGTAEKPFSESEHVLAVQKALLGGQPAQPAKASAGGGVTGPASAFEGAALFRLAFLEGSGRPGESWTLPKGREVHVGRDESCFVVLTDGKASRQHALLSHRADGLYITDLASSNGTRVNDARLGAEAHKLAEGDKIRIGDTVLAVRV